MNIDRIIHELIFKNNSVSIPGLGTLSLHYSSAEINKLTHRISPPVYELLFNTSTNSDDNSLMSTILDEYEMDKESAEKELENWVKNIVSGLDQGQEYLIKEVGIFKKSGSGIDFKVDVNSYLLAGNLGLEVTKVPIFELEGEIEKQKPIHQIQPGRSKHIKELIASAIALIIILTGVVLYRLELLQQGMDNFLGMFADSNEFKFEKYATNDTLSGRTDARTLKRKALLYAEQQNNQKLENKEVISDSLPNRVIKYYLIAGSFRTSRNAENLLRELKSKGYTPEILNFGDTTFRVSLVSYIDRHKAVEEYIELTSQNNNFKLWLYSQLISR
jgi:hypothetical protein